MDPCDGSNHSVGRAHGQPLSGRRTHDVAISQSSRFGESENTVGETVTPIGEVLFQSNGSLIEMNFADTESDFGNCHGRQSKFRIVPHEPGDYGGVGDFTKCLRDDVGIEKDQSSGPELICRLSRITASRSISVPRSRERRA